MAKRREEPKVQMVCEDCGSTDVSRDAWADWDAASQEWVLRTVFDYAHCHQCDAETNIEEKPLRRKPRAKTQTRTPAIGG